MEKIWYIKIHGNREGPFSILDLKRDKRITPTTLVWRKGFDCWQEIRYVPELQVIFEEDEAFIEREYGENDSQYPDDEIVLEMRRKDPGKWIWAVVVVIILLYLWLRMWL